MRRNRKRGLLVWIGAACCLGAAVLSLCMGSVFFAPWELPRILSGGGSGIERSILLYARMPRTLGALLAGGALALAGAVLQNVLANRLASPGIIGINAGAGLGVTI